MTSLISVVDDDVSVRDSTRRLLRSVGYKVETFESGEEFLESSAVSETDCLILDLRMPGVDGLEVQRRLNVSAAEVPIIFVTAHDDRANRQMAFDAGAREMFHKPFVANDFLAAVHAAVTQRSPSGLEGR